MSQEEFTVKNICGCRIIYGNLPISQLEWVMSGFSENAVMDPGFADKIGATLVIGEPANLERLRAADIPPSAKRQEECLAATKQGQYRLSMWLLNGDRGLSSNAMSKRLFGLPAEAGSNHPLDPADFLRCVQFLDATLAHARIHEMADVSPEWAALVDAWDEIASTLQVEMAEGDLAPKAYALIREATRG